jgi:hypothetical protein
MSSHGMLVTCSSFLRPGSGQACVIINWPYLIDSRVLADDISTIRLIILFPLYFVLTDMSMVYRQNREGTFPKISIHNQSFAGQIRTVLPLIPKTDLCCWQYINPAKRLKLDTNIFSPPISHGRQSQRLLFLYSVLQSLQPIE